MRIPWHRSRASAWAALFPSCCLHLCASSPPRKHHRRETFLRACAFCRARGGHGRIGTADPGRGVTAKKEDQKTSSEVMLE